MSNYQFTDGPDGITWVTLQPLIHEVKSILDNSKTIVTTGLSKEELKGIDFTILSLEAVFNFLKSLEAEHLVKQMIKENK